MIEIVFLGTATMSPTKERNHQAIFLKYLNNRMLFDCGENTQRQLTLAGISGFKIQNIFISHLHADHLIGLGGMIQSLNALNRLEELHVFGPNGIKEIVDFFKNWPYFECGYEIKTHEVDEGLIFENPDYSVTAFKLDHACPCYGFAFKEKVEANLDPLKLKRLGLLNNPICKELKEKAEIEWNGKKIKLKDVCLPMQKPRKIVIAIDSKPCENIAAYAEKADILVCEATFAEKERRKAHDYFHMTAKDAARAAKKAGVGKLVLTHISPRYDDPSILEKEARTILKNTVLAYDFMRVEV